MVSGSILAPFSMLWGVFLVIFLCCFHDSLGEGFLYFRPLHDVVLLYFLNHMYIYLLFLWLPQSLVDSSTSKF